MIKCSIFKKESIVLIFVSFLCGILIPFFNISTDLLDVYNFEQIFLMSRESWIEPGKFSSEIICVIIPLSLFSVFISNSILDNYDIVKTYIFIRYKNIKKWFISNSVLTMILSIISSAFYNIGIMLVCVVLGFKIADIRIMTCIILYSIFSIAMISYIISIISITVAFFTDIKNSIFISIFFLVSSIITSTLLPSKITKWLWSSHFFEYWHNPSDKIMFLVNGNTIYENGNTTTFEFSVIFLLIIAVVENILSYYSINKSDYI